MNNALSWALGIVLIVVLVAGAYYVGTKEAVAPITEETATTETPDSGKIAAPKWTLENRGEDATGAPTTNVSITFAGKSHDLGTQQGSCTVIEGSSWTLVEGEQTGVICWWAGGGVEFGVFNDTGAFEVRKGVLDEGSAEDAGTRGQFETVLVL